jgi:hypothetical protein
MRTQARAHIGIVLAATLALVPVLLVVALLPVLPLPSATAVELPVCLRIVDGALSRPSRPAEVQPRSWIRIANVCSEPLALSGWTVTDGGVQLYSFPGDFVVGPRASVLVSSGAGANGPNQRFSGSVAGWISDVATNHRSELRDAGGSIVADWSGDLDRTMVGAGDIAFCNSSGDDATAALLDGIGGSVFTLGDNSQDTGTLEQFRDCYGPSWGRHLARTRPAVGNHDRMTPGATGYFAYFGAAAGPAGRGYYSYELGAWHVVVLDSNCWDVGGCESGSPQERWLRADLATHPANCTLAVWHHPRFSSGFAGNHTEYRDLWTALAASHAELVLSGHDHDYERFAPQDADGRLDTAHGIREFVVGTGGANPLPFVKLAANSELRHTGTFGVMKLDLRADGYAWTFIAAAGDSFTDSGQEACR